MLPGIHRKKRSFSQLPARVLSLISSDFIETGHTGRRDESLLWVIEYLPLLSFFFSLVSLCQCVFCSLNVLKSCTGRTGHAQVTAQVNVLELLLIVGMHRSNGYFALPYILRHSTHIMHTRCVCSVLAIHHMYVRPRLFGVFVVFSASVLVVHWLCIGVFGLCISSSHCVISGTYKHTMC